MPDTGQASRSGIPRGRDEALALPALPAQSLSVGEPDRTESGRVGPPGAGQAGAGPGESAAGEVPRRLPVAGRGFGWLALVALASALALLAVAEVDWLHRLPSQPSRRVAVVVLSEPGRTGTAGSGRPAWRPAALALARDPAVLKDAARTGEVNPAWLADHLRVEGSCVQTAAPGQPPREGLLVHATVHGLAESRLPAIARAWAGAYISQANSSLAGARAQRQETLMEPIRECDGREGGRH